MVFNDTVGSSHCIASKVRVVSEQWNGQDTEESDRVLSSGTVPALVWIEKNDEKNPAKTAGVVAHIWTRTLSHAKQNRYPLVEKFATFIVLPVLHFDSYSVYK